MVINLLEEIIEAFKDNGVMMRYIKFVSNAEGFIEIASFISAAQNINYDNESSEIKIDPTLNIVGSTWWFSRIRIHGKEQWAFYRRPARPTIGFTPVILTTKRPAGTIKEY